MSIFGDSTLPGWMADTPGQYRLKLVADAKSIADTMNAGFAAGAGATAHGMSIGESQRHSKVEEAQGQTRLDQQQKLVDQRLFQTVPPSDQDWQNPAWLRNGSTGLNYGMQFRAEGGPVAAGQPAIVGERGPEVIVPRQDVEVIPNDDPAFREMPDMADKRPVWLREQQPSPVTSLFTKRPASSGEFLARLSQARTWDDLSAIKTTTSDVAVKYPWVRTQIQQAENRINREESERIKVEIASGVNKSAGDSAKDWLEASSRATREESAALAAFADERQFPAIKTPAGFMLPNPEATVGIKRILDAQDARLAKDNGLQPTGFMPSGRVKYGRPLASQMDAKGEWTWTTFNDDAGKPHFEALALKVPKEDGTFEIKEVRYGAPIKSTDSAEQKVGLVEAKEKILAVQKKIDNYQRQLASGSTFSGDRPTITNALNQATQELEQLRQERRKLYGTKTDVPAATISKFKPVMGDMRTAQAEGDSSPAATPTKATSKTYGTVKTTGTNAPVIPKVQNRADAEKLIRLYNEALKEGKKDPKELKSRLLKAFEGTGFSLKEGPSDEGK